MCVDNDSECAHLDEGSTEQKPTDAVTERTKARMDIERESVKRDSRPENLQIGSKEVLTGIRLPERRRRRLRQLKVMDFMGSP